ncbi:hypothetical protein [Pararhodobacter sp. SW119]|uniref:hypothetical protein n=1 Tax=Pararhodobacter sp. SW119 TaxID=2780075 RepID=UPI001ADF51F1|nr:hypothetical protein [Pararhodobacter sp. SW119]
MPGDFVAWPAALAARPRDRAQRIWDPNYLMPDSADKFVHGTCKLLDLKKLDVIRMRDCSATLDKLLALRD